MCWSEETTAGVPVAHFLGESSFSWSSDSKVLSCSLDMKGKWVGVVEWAEDGVSYSAFGASFFGVTKLAFVISLLALRKIQ